VISLKYTMRISITAILLIVNFIFYYNLESFSVYDIFAFLLNAIAGWVIGYYLDKYFFSKKMLLSTKNVLLDYSYALDSVGDAIGITNEVGQFEYVNEAHAVLYGYKNKDQFLTKSWKDLYSPEILDEVSQSIIPSFPPKYRTVARGSGRSKKRWYYLSHRTHLIDDRRNEKNHLCGA
jgi:diguanylate cyclase